MARHIVSIVCAAFCAGAAYISLEKERTDKCTFLKYNGDEELESIILQKRTICLMVGMIFLLCTIGAEKIVYQASGSTNVLKMLIAMIGLTGAACVDLREHRIPNFYTAIMAISGVLLHTVGLVTGQAGAMAYVTTAAITTVVVVLFMLAASMLTRGGIGMGDIKLLGSLSLLGGVMLITGTLFFSALLSAGTAIILLVARKKTLQDAIPFGPFIWAGFLLTVIFLDY